MRNAVVNSKNVFTGSMPEHRMTRDDGMGHSGSSKPLGDCERERSRPGTQSIEVGSTLDSSAARKPVRLRMDRFATPIGAALLVTDEVGVLRALDFHDCESRMLRLLRVHYSDLAIRPGTAPVAVRRDLGLYFEGEFEALRRIAWSTAGTNFQLRVWNALVGIPSGRTRSYGELARELGNPLASRAVGLANRSNPIALVVPCHRVIGARGDLTGYAGGLHRKDWLLRHEGALFAAGMSADLFAR